MALHVNNGKDTASETVLNEAVNSTTGANNMFIGFDGGYGVIQNSAGSEYTKLFSDTMSNKYKDLGINGTPKILF